MVPSLKYVIMNLRRCDYFTVNKFNKLIAFNITQLFPHPHQMTSGLGLPPTSISNLISSDSKTSTGFSLPTKKGRTASAGNLTSAAGSGVGTVTGVDDFLREEVDNLRKEEKEEDLEILSRDPVD